MQENFYCSSWGCGTPLFPCSLMLLPWGCTHPWCFSCFSLVWPHHPPWRCRRSSWALLWGETLSSLVGRVRAESKVFTPSLCPPARRGLCPEAVSGEEHEYRAGHGVSPRHISNNMPKSIALTDASDGRVCPSSTQTPPAPIAR